MTVIHLAEMVLKVADGGGQFLACFPPGRPPAQASFHFFEQSGGAPTLLLEPTPTLFEPLRAGLPAGTNSRRRTLQVTARMPEIQNQPLGKTLQPSPVVLSPIGDCHPLGLGVALFVTRQFGFHLLIKAILPILRRSRYVSGMEPFPEHIIEGDRPHHGLAPAFFTVKHAGSIHSYGHPPNLGGGLWISILPALFLGLGNQANGFGDVLQIAARDVTAVVLD